MKNDQKQISGFRNYQISQISKNPQIHKIRKFGHEAGHKARRISYASAYTFGDVWFKIIG